ASPARRGFQYELRASHRSDCSRARACKQKPGEARRPDGLLHMPPMNTRQWRSLDELAGTPDFRKWLQREFPPLASEWPNDVSRRRFLKLMGASFALAGLNACTRQPVEKIVPYVKQPEELVPGQP